MSGKGASEMRPVETIMAVDRFVNPEWLVELEVDAVIQGWGDCS